MNAKRIAAFFFCLLLLSWASQSALSDPPKNVIFFIGDGMGFEQVKAAGMYENGTEGTLCFESFTYQAQVITHSADYPDETDSAAAGTALATGVKVSNGVISMAYPGDGHELQTLLEYASAQNKLTGLVTTAFMTHATPAAFGAHEPSRGNYSQIATDYLSQTQPNVLFGGLESTGSGMTSAAALAAGYTVVTDRDTLQALDTGVYTDETNTFVSGQFPGSDGHMPYEYSQSAGYSTLPHLSEMTAVALDILDNDSDGFFLMVEGGRIDHACHGNGIEDAVYETIEFSAAVQQAIDWAGTRTDTLIIVTADHETGGLLVTKNNGQDSFPDVSWSTTGHTNANVPVYAWGVNAHMVSGTMDNTDMFELATVPEPATLSLLLLAGMILIRRKAA